MRPGRKRGAKAQAIGVSGGAETTKIHALSDTLGRPITLGATAGKVADVTMADPRGGSSRLPFFTPINRLRGEKEN